MQDDKSRSTDRQKTSDQFSNSASLDYPAYLDTVKQNLQISLPSYCVEILSKRNQLDYNDDEDTGLFSITLSSQKLYKNRFQIFTEVLLDQSAFCFYVKHLVTLNYLQLVIQNRQSISMALNFCNKINKQMENFRLIIDPVSGKIYFQTKSFINQSSLSSLKKLILRHDCFYTEIIYCSVKKAQKYIDLILFILGQISLSELITNQQISKQFPFLKQCQQILDRLDKNIFYIPFLDIKQQKMSNPTSHTRNQRDNAINFLKNLRSSNYQQKDYQKKQNNLKQQKISKAKEQILNNSLQYFSLNTQNTIKLFTPKSPYSNIDFSVIPLRYNHLNPQLQKTIIDLEKKTSFQSKRLLSFIEIVHVEQSFLSQQKNNGWKLISEGGFGIIEIGTVKFKNLSNSYTQPDTGFSLVIKQQMIRKRDKNMRKGKIERQRKILQRLQFLSHPNIMSFYISFQYEYENCIFSDYTPNMSLDLYLKKNQYSVNFSQKISFLVQAIEGLQFLHQQSIVHLDIKPGNMLVSKQLRLLLSDFGEAFVVGEDDPITHNHAYTVPYCAPQIFPQKPQLTQKVDIYAIGACMLKIILGQAFMDTFLRRKFAKRLCSHEVLNFGIGQKFEKSFLYPIIKIIFFIAERATSQSSDVRPQLAWIAEILTQCRNFIFALIY